MDEVRVPLAEDPARAATRWAPRLRALGDETRLRLALLIAAKPRTVKDLEAATGLTQALVSYHLKPLREQGLVTATPVGRSNRYELCCDRVVGLVAALGQLASSSIPSDQA